MDEQLPSMPYCGAVAKVVVVVVVLVDDYFC
jgi:hypothetical protein